MADSRFDNVKYVYWLKVCMALIYAKEGLEHFTDTWAGQFYEMLKNRAGDKTCYSCSKEELKRQWSKGNMRCGSNVCNSWLVAIQSHLSTSSQSIEWNNIDISCLPSEPWECIKPYLPFGCETVTETKKADIAAILSLYINNNYSHQYIGGTADKFIKVKDIRNKVMHSTTLELAEQEMEDAMDQIISLLQCPGKLSTDENCKGAITKVQQLRSDVLEVSLHKEYELRSLNARVQAMEGEVQHTISLYNKLNDKIEEQASTDMATLKTDVDNIKSDYGTLHKYTKDMESEIKHMNLFLSKFIKANGIEGICMDQVAEKAASIISSVTGMKTEITRMDKRVESCEHRLDQNEKDIEELKPFKKQRMMNKQERLKELQKQLVDLYSKRRCSISILPLRPELKKKLGTLYVCQEMLEKDPRGPKKPPPDITDKFEPSHEQKDKKVNRLNEVFYTDNKLCKDIYITGEAGVGKSTFCDHIVNMWLAAHTGTTVNYTEYSSQDLETMKQFPLLFYVQLKGETLDSDTDIYANLIEKQWDLDTSVKEFLTEEHCVIIADALDECTSGIPKRGVRNNSTVLTTSRPWKLETLRTDIEGSKIDKHIEIVCLDEKSVETLTEKILPVLAEESGTTVKNSDNFIKEMKEKGLESFLRIPVLLIQILCLWHDNVTIGKSKTSIYCNLVHHQIQVYIKKLSAKDQKKLLPNSETISPVNCKVSKCLCRAFNEMLLKVGKMALNTLLSGKLEYELVFDHNITEFHELSEQEIERCLAIGILSQHKLFGKITKLEKFISFVHKSNQEFFVSIYLACKMPISNIREVLANYICSLDKMLKLEKIIMFVSGLNREMGREMANLLLEAAGRDPRIQEYRQTVYGWCHYELVLNVHNVILAAVEECRHNPHEQQQKFHLDDIYVDVKNVSRVLSCFPVMEISRPASITMEGEIVYNYVQVDAVMSHVQNTAGLQKVYLFKCTIGSRETAVKLVPQSLCVLDLWGVNLPHEALTTLSHKLKTKKLRELELSSLICWSHGELGDGKCGVTFDLTRQSHLERLRIVDCNMSGWSLPTATPQMEDVHLSSVTIPGAMLARFLRGLPQTEVRVNLGGVTVRPAGDFVSCLEQIRGSRRVVQDSVRRRREGKLFVNEFEFI